MLALSYTSPRLTLILRATLATVGYLHQPAGCCVNAVSSGRIGLHPLATLVEPARDLWINWVECMVECRCSRSIKMLSKTSD
jgi:hypothetical protein